MTGFRPDILEKVAHLLQLLHTLNRHPFLKDKLVLKGGTALNLFILNVPRLSVDIDLNYVGAESREHMLAERPKIDLAVQAVFSREGFTVRHIPDDHAGGKWQLRYPSALGHTGNLEVDINFMFRIPLWPVRLMDSHKVGSWQANTIPVTDIHELAAGKLCALLSRKQVRDLFDCYHILRIEDLDNSMLRIAFVLYGGMNRKDWRSVSIEDVGFDSEDLKRQLVPTLHIKTTDMYQNSIEYGHHLVAECRNRLLNLLPFSDGEMEFLNRLLDYGEIKPSLLTPDHSLQERINRHPLLNWKALNVKNFKSGRQTDS